MTADEIVRTLGLKPHPEGGWYREVFRSPEEEGQRGALTSIYFLLTAGQRSHWHRVTDGDEVWNFHGGAPLLLKKAVEGKPIMEIILGLDFTSAQHPQYTIEAGAWQAAETLGDWTLVGCAVAPAFHFSKFELAPPGWEPTQ